MKGESSSCTGCYLDTDRLIVFFCFHLQFQNNNNYMNMAEANGALLAAGDVSIFYFFFSILKFPFEYGKFN